MNTEAPVIRTLSDKELPEGTAVRLGFGGWAMECNVQESCGTVVSCTGNDKPYRIAIRQNASLSMSSTESSIPRAFEFGVSVGLNITR